MNGLRAALPLCYQVALYGFALGPLGCPVGVIKQLSPPETALSAFPWVKLRAWVEVC